MATIDSYLDELLAPEPPPAARVAAGDAAGAAGLQPDAQVGPDPVDACGSGAAAGMRPDAQAQPDPMDAYSGGTAAPAPGTPADARTEGTDAALAHADENVPMVGDVAHAHRARGDVADASADAVHGGLHATSLDAQRSAAQDALHAELATIRGFDAAPRSVPPAPVRAPALPDLSAFMPPPGSAIAPVARTAVAAAAAGVGRTRTATGGHRWLRVRVDADSYAFELLRVQEVVRLAPIVAMRGASHAVLGVMNLRGRIVPVFDLGLWLDVGAVRADEHSRIVVIERNDELIGVLVTMVEDVVSLEREHVEPPLPGADPGPTLGVARVTAAPTVLLDADALFD